MMKESVGSITESEKKEILRLYERKNALKELFVTLASPYLIEEERKILYEKIVDDMEKTFSQYENWWRVIAARYKWKSRENWRWMIDFNTNEVYLEDNGEDSCGEECKKELGIADLMHNAYICSRPNS